MTFTDVDFIVQEWKNKGYKLESISIIPKAPNFLRLVIEVVDDEKNGNSISKDEREEN